MPPKAKKPKEEEEEEEEAEISESESEEEEVENEAEVSNSEDDNVSIGEAENDSSDSESENKTVTTYKSDTLYEYKNNMMNHKHHKSQAQYTISTTVPKEKRITSNLLQQTEYSRVIGLRVQQLEAGDPARIPNTKGMNMYEIAIQELLSKKISFIIARHINSNTVEKWSTKEMDIDTTRFCTIGPANDKIRTNF
jgi:DNA-directed RNA polymerase subunit K/omega